MQDESRSAPPPVEHVTVRRKRTGLYLRFGLLVALVVGGWLAVRFTPLGEMLTREELVAKLELARNTPGAPAIFIAAWLVVSIFGIPVSPIVFAGGAVFGVLWGWLLNLAGALVGSTAGFVIARFLGHDFLTHIVGRSRLERIERLLARHGFWTVLRLRFVPVPFLLVNSAAALVGMRLSRFLAASALGLAPSLLVYSYFSDALVRVAAADRAGLVWNLALAMILLLLVTLVPTLARRRSKALDADGAEPPAADGPR